MKTNPARPALLAAVLALCLLAATGAQAQNDGVEDYRVQDYASRDSAESTRTSTIAFGLRAGYTDWGQLGQIHFGAHAKLGEVFPNIHFTPNIEAGVGDGVTLISANGDLAYSFTEFVSYPWNLSAGGSLGFHYLNPEFGESDTQLGLSALLGLEYTLANDHQVLLELRLGVMDSPDFKLTVGYTLF